MVHTVQLNCKCGKVLLFPHICKMFTYLLSFCPKVCRKSPNKTAFLHQSVGRYDSVVNHSNVISAKKQKE